MIAYALDTLGLDLSYLSERLDFPLDSVADLSASNIRCYEWVPICETLCLWMDSISFEYNYEWHREGIWHAIQCGTFDLPLNRRVLWVLARVAIDQFQIFARGGELSRWKRLTYYARIPGRYRSRRAKLNDLVVKRRAILASCPERPKPSWVRRPDTCG